MCHCTFRTTTGARTMEVVQMQASWPDACILEVPLLKEFTNAV
jgi:hypothetical protein